MAEKILQTRIINKNGNLFTVDGVKGWDNSTLELKQGEIALAKITTKQPDGHGGIIEVPAYLMKVGVGGKNFSDSAWLYAKASDVYGWAKKESLDYNDLPEVLRNEIDALQAAVGEDGSVATQISTAITTALSNLDNTQSGDGSFVKAVTQTDGKVAVTYGKIEIADVEGLQNALNLKATVADLNAEVQAREALDTRVTTAEGQISALDTRVTNNATAIATEKTRAEGAESALGGRIDALAQTHTTDKNALVAEDERLAGLIADNAQAIADEAARAAGVENGLNSRLGVAEGKITTLEGQVATLNAATTLEGVGTLAQRPAAGKVAGAIWIATDNNKEYVWDGAKWVELGDTTAELNEISNLKTALQNEQAAREGADTTLQGNINTLSGTVTANKEAYDAYVTSNNTRVKAVEDKNTEQDGLLAGLRTDVDTKATSAALEQAQTSLQGKINEEATARANADTALGQRIDGSNERITALETTVGDADNGLVKAVADNADAIADNAEAIETEKGRAEAAEGALDTRLTTAEGTIANKAVRVENNTLVYGAANDTIIFDCGSVE